MFPNLNAEQARNGFTNQYVADYLEISRPTFERKKSKGKFSIEQATKLCKLYGCAYDYLFSTERLKIKVKRGQKNAYRKCLYTQGRNGMGVQGGLRQGDCKACAG